MQWLNCIIYNITIYQNLKRHTVITEAVAQSCSVKKVLLEISKNTFFYRTPPVAASIIKNQPTIVELKDQVSFSRYSENIDIQDGCR